MKRRKGMALAITIAVVSLVSILAVATLSLAGRMMQRSTLGIRDAQLDGAAASGLAAAVGEWRRRAIGRLAMGAHVRFTAVVPGVPVVVSVVVTRAGPEIFWIVSEATAGDATRGESLVVRLRQPRAEVLLDQDSSDVSSLDFVPIDSIAAGAQSVLPGGAILESPSGVVHVRGDAVLSAGAGSGILIVEGRLSIVGQFTFSGIIIVRGGISVAAPNVLVTGLVRAAGDPPVVGTIHLTKSETAVQDVLSEGLTPRMVAGRRWAEVH